MQRIIRKIISYSLIVPCFVVGCCMVPVIVFAAWFGEIDDIKAEVSRPKKDSKQDKFKKLSHDYSMLADKHYALAKKYDNMVNIIVGMGSEGRQHIKIAELVSKIKSVNQV